MATKSTDDGQTFLDTEAAARTYLAQQFPGQSVDALVAAAKAEQINQREDPDAWWDGIDQDELVAWIKSL